MIHIMIWNINLWLHVVETFLSIKNHFLNCMGYLYILDLCISNHSIWVRWMQTQSWETSVKFQLKLLTNIIWLLRTLPIWTISIEAWNYRTKMGILSAWLNINRKGQWEIKLLKGKFGFSGSQRFKRITDTY